MRASRRFGIRRAPILLTNQTRAVAGRMRPDMRALTHLLPYGYATSQAQMILQMDYYDPARHTVSPKLVLANNTVVEPSAVVHIPDPVKPTRHLFRADFNLPAGTTSSRVRIDSTTNSVIHVPFVQDVQLNSY